MTVKLLTECSGRGGGSGEKGVGTMLGSRRGRRRRGGRRWRGGSRDDVGK